MNAVILAIGEIDVLLLRVLRERDVPGGAGAQGFLVDEPFLDKGPIGFEDLDAVVGAVANIELVIVGEFGAMHGIAELLGWRAFGIVTAEVGVVGLVAVSAPVALVLAGFGVKDDDAVVAVAIGHVDFVGLGIDKNLGGQA